MFLVTRVYTFAAAHRIEGHPKCGRLHGHNYNVTVTLGSNILEDGMVVDYGEMDKWIKPIIDTFDHHYLVSRTNCDAMCPYAEIALKNGDGKNLPISHSTAEELAMHIFSLLSTAAVRADWPVKVMQVQVDESPKSTAVFHP